MCAGLVMWGRAGEWRRLIHGGCGGWGAVPCGIYIHTYSWPRLRFTISPNRCRTPPEQLTLKRSNAGTGMSLLHGMQRSLDRARIHSVIWQARLSPRNVAADGCLMLVREFGAVRVTVQEQWESKLILRRVSER